MYIEMGGSYDDVLSLPYWDFLNIIKTMDERKRREAGKPIVHDSVPESNKDMIKRRKELHG